VSPLNSTLYLLARRPIVVEGGGRLRLFTPGGGHRGRSRRGTCRPPWCARPANVLHLVTLVYAIAPHNRGLLLLPLSRGLSGLVGRLMVAVVRRRRLGGAGYQVWRVGPRFTFRVWMAVRGQADLPADSRAAWWVDAGLMGLGGGESGFGGEVVAGPAGRRRRPWRWRKLPVWTVRVWRSW